MKAKAVLSLHQAGGCIISCAVYAAAFIYKADSISVLVYCRVKPLSVIITLVRSCIPSYIVHLIECICDLTYLNVL
jgi:hypothetical protein